MLKKFLLIVGICLLYALIGFITFRVIVKVHNTTDPIVAKKAVILAFFTNLVIFAGSGYFIYKLKIPANKK